MRIGIISDIHGNYEALTAAYEALMKTGCDTVVCIGDIVGYGASPGECIDFIRENSINSVKGNHDSYTTQERKYWDIQPYARDVIYWTQDRLSDEHIEWLRELPYAVEFDNVTFVHASLEAQDGEYWPYILDTKSALFHFFLQNTQFAFFGHTHIPLFFTYDDSHQISIEILKSRKVEAGEGKKFLINPGAVGQPRDFDSRSSAIVFEQESNEITVLRTNYDIKSAQNKIIDAGLPAILAERLSRGN